MRAVEGNLGHSLKERWRQDAEPENTHVGPMLPEHAPSEGPRSTVAIEIPWVLCHDETKTAPF